MGRQNSKEESLSRKGSTDASALPSTASWANGNAPVVRTRRASQAASRATPSPQLIQASLSTQKPEEAKEKEISSTGAVSKPSPESKSSNQLPANETTFRSTKPTLDPVLSVYNEVLKGATFADFRFIFDDTSLSSNDRALVDELPVMIDPYGGAKRRIMQDKEAAERARLELEAKEKLETQTKSSVEDIPEDDNLIAGSLALGGEPEDNPRSGSARGAIQRPSQPTSTSTFSAEPFSMNFQNRSLTPQQRQQLALLNSNNQQTSGLSQLQSQNTAFEMSDFDRRGPQYSAAQYDQISSHQRHGSRYFNTDPKSNNNSTRFQGQQQSFYSGSVQGPPPGLPTAGTPPVSGGGMFAHGQGFTNPGFGATKDANTDINSRGRSGTNTGHDLSKRELLLSLQNPPLRSPPLSTPAPGLLNPLYGQYSGAYQDPGLVKQRKKGKKHRHANTSSSGGVEHLADPGIVQARIHQGNANGQGLFGGNQGGYQQSNAMYGGGYNRW